MKYLIPILVALCIPTLAFCQEKDITGLWKGAIYNDNTRQSYQYEVYIHKDKGKYQGYSQTWYLIDGKTYYGIKKLKVSIARDGKVVIQDAGLVENNYPVAPPKNVFQLNVLDFSNTGTESFLNGDFVTNRTKDYDELTGKTNLTKVDLMICEAELLKHIRGNGNDLDVSIQ